LPAGPSTTTTKKMNIVIGIVIGTAMIVVTILLFWLCRPFLEESKEAAKKITEGVKDLTAENPSV
jgi:uncharacterized protein YpmB